MTESSGRIRAISTGLLLLALCAPTLSAANSTVRDYGLSPQEVAADTYVLVGRDEDFTLQNGGNIVNTGFIVTSAGVVVVDSGPSRLYGEQLRQAISTITDRPIVRVYNTHLHPDHFLGNQAFKDVPIFASSRTMAALQQQGDGFTNNMYRLVDAWMKGTEPVFPNEQIDVGTVTIGDHTLEIMEMNGHSDSDLVLYDRTTGVLFAGDLVFYNRAPTTPHAHIDRWLSSLERLRQIPFKTIVPGHGGVTDRRAIDQTAAYLKWLHSSLSRAAADGLDMAQTLFLPIPEAFSDMAVLPAEYHRSVAHMYPQLERLQLPPAAPRR